MIFKNKKIKQRLKEKQSEIAYVSSESTFLRIFVSFINSKKLFDIAQNSMYQANLLRIVSNLQRKKRIRYDIDIVSTTASKFTASIKVSLLLSSTQFVRTAVIANSRSVYWIDNLTRAILTLRFTKYV